MLTAPDWTDWPATVEPMTGALWDAAAAALVVLRSLAGLPGASLVLKYDDAITTAPDAAKALQMALANVARPASPSPLTGLVREAIEAWGYQFDNEGEVNGGDLVDWFGDWRLRAKNALGLLSAPIESPPDSPLTGLPVDSPLTGT